MRKQGAVKNRMQTLAVANKEIQLEILKLLGNDLMDLKFDGTEIKMSVRKELDKELARDLKGLLKAQVVDFDHTQKPVLGENNWQVYVAKNNGSPLLASLNTRSTGIRQLVIT